jgi:hypothetical protein
MKGCGAEYVQYGAVMGKEVAPPHRAAIRSFGLQAAAAKEVKDGRFVVHKGLVNSFQEAFLCLVPLHPATEARGGFLVTILKTPIHVVLIPPTHGHGPSL